MMMQLCHRKYVNDTIESVLERQKHRKFEFIVHAYTLSMKIYKR